MMNYIRNVKTDWIDYFKSNTELAALYLDCGAVDRGKLRVWRDVGDLPTQNIIIKTESLRAWSSPEAVASCSTDYSPGSRELDRWPWQPRSSRLVCSSCTRHHRFVPAGGIRIRALWRRSVDLTLRLPSILERGERKTSWVIS